MKARSLFGGTIYPALTKDLISLLKSLYVAVIDFKIISYEQYFDIKFRFKEIPQLPSEMLMEIGKHITDGVTWKNFISSGNEIYKAVKPIKKEKVAELSNHLWTLIKKFPDWQWDWISVLSNVNTKWHNIIDDFPLKESLWNATLVPTLFEDLWTAISRNPNIVLDNVLSHPSLPWYFLSLSRNINIPLWFIKETPHLKWNWGEISSRKDVTWDIVIKNPKLPWDIGGLSRNENVTFDIVIQNPQLSWNHDLVQVTKNITWNDVINNPNYPWNYQYLSKIVPIEFVFEHPDFNWNWDRISSLISLETFLKYSNFSWDMRGLSRNKNIPFEIVKIYSHFNWDFEQLSSIVSIDTILNNLDYPWDWMVLSYRMPLNIIEEHPNWPWVYHESYISIASNPNLTWKFVVEHEHRPWGLDELSENNYGKERP